MTGSSRNTISTIKAHPNFRYSKKFKGYENDISLVKLRIQVDLESPANEINPVCLPERRKSYKSKFSHHCKRNLCRGFLKRLRQRKREKNCEMDDEKYIREGKILTMSRYKEHEYNRCKNKHQFFSSIVLIVTSKSLGII